MKIFQTTIHIKCRYPANIAAIRTPIDNVAHNKGTGTFWPPVVVAKNTSFSCGGLWWSEEVRRISNVRG
ncbi:hypothetical protein Hanom_Chr07g00629161 [Helianthus anomalus]